MNWPNGHDRVVVLNVATCTYTGVGGTGTKAKRSKTNLTNKHFRKAIPKRSRPAMSTMRTLELGRVFGEIVGSRVCKYSERGNPSIKTTQIARRTYRHKDIATQKRTFEAGSKEDLFN